MDKERPNRLQWALLLATLVVLCGVNITQNSVLKKRMAAMEKAVESAKAGTAFQREAMIDAQELATEFQGRQLIWPQMEQLVGEGPTESSFSGHGLVLFISELACNACRDIETQFVSSVAEMTGGAAVRIVVHAANPRWVLNYAEQNGVEVPVYFDPKNLFGSANGVSDSPLLLLTDEEGTVVASHYPLPETPDWSQPFHDLSLRLLQLI